MKKLLLALTLVFCVFFAQSQNCTPSWPTGGGAGINPDSLTNLPVAYELVPYSANVNFKVPLDTTANIGGFNVAVTINNITVTSVSGLSAIPATVPFTYVTNPSNGVFPGGSLGCALITGTAAAGSAGVYPIQFSVTANATINQTSTPVQQPYTIDYYKIVVLANSSIQMINENEPSIIGIAPNPAINSTSLQYYLPAKTDANLFVYNQLGQLMQQIQLNPGIGLNNYNIDTQDFPVGNYFATILLGNERLTIKFTVSK